MDEIKELRVVKSGREVEVHVQSDTLTALALLSILVLAMEEETGISVEKILDTIGNAIEMGKREQVKISEEEASELEALGTPIVEWLHENSFLHGVVIVDSNGIRLVQQEEGIPTKGGEKGWKN